MGHNYFRPAWRCISPMPAVQIWDQETKVHLELSADRHRLSGAGDTRRGPHAPQMCAGENKEKFVFVTQVWVSYDNTLVIITG